MMTFKAGNTTGTTVYTIYTMQSVYNVFFRGNMLSGKEGNLSYLSF